MQITTIRLKRDWQNGRSRHSRGQVLQIQDVSADELIRRGIAEAIDGETLFDNSNLDQMKKMVRNAISEAQKTGVKRGSCGDDERDNFRKFWFGSDSISTSDVGFESPAQFLNATKNLKLGTQTDLRLSEYSKATGASTLIGADGGYTVPIDFAFPAMLEMERHPLLSKLTRFPVRGSSLSIPRLWDYDRSSYRFSAIDSVPAVGEGSLFSSKKPTFEKMTLSPKKHGFLLYATSELLEDSGYIMGDILSGCMTQACLLELERQVISGIGGNEMLGILNASCLVSQSRETASTITYGDICNMWSRLRPRARRNAVWICSNAALPMLTQLHADWQYSSSDFSELVRADVATNLDGGLNLNPLAAPLMVSDFCSNLGTAGDLLVCDPTMFAVGKKEANYNFDGFRIDYSPIVGFTTDEHVWKVVFRADGQPMESTTFTPENGGNSQSSFVQLS